MTGADSSILLMLPREHFFMGKDVLTLMKGDEGVEAAEKGANLLLLFDVNR